ncbi:hypothetical protein M3Y99_01400900 [Aphelenchoides fujianensis]|nr:hypothetical protein M3Y99_01400900 [Aphelenchoides fujianensis]
MKLLAAIAFLFLFLLAANATPEDPLLTFEALYKYGKNAYTDKNWHDCVGFMKRAAEDFNHYKDEMLWCRQRCDRAMGQREEFSELSLMYTNAQKALCLLRCRQDKFGTERPSLRNYQIYQEFRDRKPFHYMQLCYWKMNDLENAVKHAYTYLVYNPADEDSLENIRFYMKQPEFNERMLVDLLQKPFEGHYIKGIEDYSAERWKSCSTEFRQGITQFFSEVNDCRHLCEDVLDWSSLEGDNPGDLGAYISVLRCKNACPKKISLVNGRTLHICEYNLNHGAFASQSVANALLLDPENIVMRRNKLFYLDKYQRNDLFEPSEEVAAYYKRQTLEQRFLQFVDDRFRFVDGELTAENTADKKPLEADVYMGDDFDYAQLQLPLLNSQECSAFQAGFSSQLTAELHERIGQRYGRPPTFKSTRCAQEGQRLQSGCERGALIVSVDAQRCGAVLSEDFDGCAVVFCV